MEAEVWAFVQIKEGHRTEDHDESLGDCYTWVAIERNSKLVLASVTGKRSAENAMELMRKVRRATSPDVRFQLTTDGFPAYPAAVDEMLGDRCDYAQLIKVYRAPREGEQRYSPAKISEVVPIAVFGNPDPERICTSIVERQNLTMRTQIRRLTRLTNAFSKKLENHQAAIALHLAYYNFCRIHGSLRVTPAMEAGVTTRVWTIGDLLTA